MPDPTMAGVNIEYLEDQQRLFISIPQRKYRVVIERVNPSSSLFKIRYETGMPIPQLSSFYTGKTEALQALRGWLNRINTSKAILHDEWFGEENPPELKTKRARKSKVDGSESPT